MCFLPSKYPVTSQQCCSNPKTRAITQASAATVEQEHPLPFRVYIQRKANEKQLDVRDSVIVLHILKDVPTILHYATAQDIIHE